MRIVFLGHAGIYIETSGGSVLCDPWFNPAYFASWFPFPRNDDLDVARFAEPDFLYVSHLHRDHFDPEFLRQHVSKQATVLLPDFPVDNQRDELSALGFREFLPLRPDAPTPAGGLRFSCVVEASPSDGPLGDSALVVEDGEHRIFNQNDARPRHLDRVCSLGEFDAHFLQFSGANWFPVVYDFPPGEMAKLVEEKRTRGMERARDFIMRIGARHVFPCAGPPCFLDDGLFEFNEVEGVTSPYPDQSAFLEQLRRWGIDWGKLVVPGSVVSLDGPDCTVSHPQGDEHALEPFRNKRAYLAAYRADKREKIEVERSSWRRQGVDVVAELGDFVEPLLQGSGRLCERIGTSILVRSRTASAVIDFESRQVRPWSGERCPFRFMIDDDVLRCAVADRYQDWVNSLFLSMRFSAARDLPYLEDIYTFFKSLSPERMRYVETLLSAGDDDVSVVPPDARAGQWCRIGDWWVQRQCPHRQADLSQFGRIEGTVLTCAMHGWQFDLSTGECLTAQGRWRIQAHRDGSP